MTEASAAWSEVGSRFTALGQKLRQHFDEARSADAATPEGAATSGDPTATTIADSIDATSEATGPNAGADTGGGAAGSGAGGSGAAGSGAGGNDAVQEALRKLGDALDAVVEAVTSTVKDPAVKTDVKEMGGALSAAFSRSFAEVSEDLRKAFNRQRGRGPDSSAAGDPPSSA